MTNQIYPNGLALACTVNPDDLLHVWVDSSGAAFLTTDGISVYPSHEDLTTLHAWLGAHLGLTPPTPEHPPVFGYDVRFEDIQAGDTLSLIWGWWATKEGAVFVGDNPATYGILDRPAKPQLPTEPGTLIVAGKVVYVLESRADDLVWRSLLDPDDFYSYNWPDGSDWTPLGFKVVEA